ncbi:tetratricopeptide repeat protein [bacterium]|nr:tetratricopeptide repeat protein [bacterium]
MNRRLSIRTVAALIAVAVVLWSPAGLAAQEIDVSEAIERARSLEQTGLVADAASYIRGLMGGDSDLATSPLLALELARLTDNALEALDLADTVLAQSRDQGLRSTAYTLRGDFLYASGHYEAAAIEYAAAIVRRQDYGRTILKQAASLLASGDATAATLLYRQTSGDREGSTAAWASIGLGWAILATGNPSEAGAHFEATALEHAENGVRAPALIGAATCSEALGEFSHAAELLRACAVEFPGSFEAVMAADRLETVLLRASEKASEEAALDAEPTTDTAP